MSALSREAAREFVKELWHKNGGISAAHRQVTPEPVLKSLDNMRRRLEPAIQTLAANIYSKDVRFILELILNAEDNQYTAKGIEPCITFTVCRGTIVVDSNEDGFRDEDVEAICSVGKSRKKVSCSCMGEKGIGFKSVFRVAHKVQIQSGPFSFSFEHKYGDQGMGMVTPENQEHEELPEGVRTRMTLTVAKPSEVAQIIQELRDLPDTLLLFLTKIKRIVVNILDPASGEETKITHSYEYDPWTAIGKLTKVCSSRTSSEETKNFYHITKSQVYNLPKDDLKKLKNQVEVVLAFPIDGNHGSVIELQQVYAFLPLRSVGFNFLIQSDFITQASREDISQSPWNTAILRGVADTFRDAVLQFCHHPSLRYDWMDYLPSKSISEPCWDELRHMIMERLRTAQCMRSISNGLRYPAQLRTLPQWALDQHGEPLFADLVFSDVAYLSPRYNVRRPSETLRDLGTRDITLSEMLTRVETDLTSVISRMRVRSTKDEWHTRAAKLLLKALEDGPAATIERVYDLPLIPLQTGQWVSSRNDVFLPDSNGIPIPNDLGLKLIEPNALENASRRDLFSKLGAEHCEPRDVMNLIYEKYERLDPVDLAASVAHLRFLYWNCDSLETDWYPLVDHVGQPEYYSYEDVDVYFESEEEYGPQELFRTVIPSDSNDDCAPGLGVRFLNPKYLQAVPADACHNGKSWVSWLETVVGVRRSPRLLGLEDNSELSQEYRYIVAHRPNKLIGALKTHWSSYEVIPFGAGLELSRAKVPCENVPDTILSNTLLPLPCLKERCKELGVNGKLPFLRMPVELNDQSQRDWEFLSVFWVGITESIWFYINILGNIMLCNPTKCGPETLGHLLDVYLAIDRHCCSEAVRIAVKAFFHTTRAIYIPTHGPRKINWEYSSNCLWKGPKYLMVKQPLAVVQEYEKLEGFFCNTLNIGNALWEHYVEELKYMRLQRAVSPSNVRDIYHRMQANLPPERSWESLRSDFEISEMIYVPAYQTWHKVSSCFWTKIARVSGKAGLSTPYPELQDFFCRILGVKPPDFNSLVRELGDLAKSTLSIEQVKGFIEEIIHLGPTEMALDELLAAEILPVRSTDGRVALRSARDQFVIVDRPEYGEAFEGKVPKLCFDLQEVRFFRPFLLALGLNDRFMSVSLKEKSTVKGGSLEPTLTSAIRQKAYAFYRCAVHYDSHRTKNNDLALYHLLSGVEVFVSDEMSRDLSIVLAGQCISVEGAKASFHVEEDHGQLRLYVPKYEDDREVCFLEKFPRGMLDVLGVSGSAATAIVSLLGATNLDVVDRLLRARGIVQVPGIERPQEPMFIKDTDQASIEINTATSSCAQNASNIIPGGTSEQADNTSSKPNIAIDPSESIPSTPTPSDQTRGSFMPRSSASWSSSSQATYRWSPQPPITPNTDTSHLPSPGVTNLVPSEDCSTKEYRDLLDRVMTAADTARFPDKGVYDFEELRNVLPTASPSVSPFVVSRSLRFGMRSQDDIRSNIKLGAAGELYIFEMLLRMDLPGFSRDNWKSTIREEVRIQQKYADLEPWSGYETSDIVYDDTHGRFTWYLIGKGYLTSEIWRNARPRYYLEVKTTTHACETPFFVSKWQYRRMQQMALDADKPADEVYLIFRVFNLDHGDVGIRIYLDPVTLHRNGELDFTLRRNGESDFAAEYYTVVPAE